MILRNQTVILGNAGVGKSALVNQFHSQGQLSEQYTPVLWTHIDYSLRCHGEISEYPRNNHHGGFLYS